MVQKVIPFHTPLWRFNIGVAPDSWVETCYSMQGRYPSTKKSNVGGYQSPFVNLSEEFPDLYKKLSPEIIKVCIDSGMDLSVGAAWVNINKKYDFNMTHLHTGCCLSGVVYLKTDERSGNIVFENPSMVSLFPIDTSLKDFYGAYYIDPTPGDVIIFPAYLRHYVNPNLSENDRISVAFNLL